MVSLGLEWQFLSIVNLYITLSNGLSFLLFILLDIGSDL